MDGDVGRTEDEYDPSRAGRRVMLWARTHGATTLGEVYDLLPQLEVSNDVPEVLGHDDTLDEVREDLEVGLELVGADASLAALL